MLVVPAKPTRHPPAGEGSAATHSHIAKVGTIPGGQVERPGRAVPWRSCRTAELVGCWHCTSPGGCRRIQTPIESESGAGLNRSTRASWRWWMPRPWLRWFLLQPQCRGRKRSPECVAASRLWFQAFPSTGGLVRDLPPSIIQRIRKKNITAITSTSIGTSNAFQAGFKRPECRSHLRIHGYW